MKRGRSLNFNEYYNKSYQDDDDDDFDFVDEDPGYYSRPKPRGNLSDFISPLARDPNGDDGEEEDYSEYEEEEDLYTEEEIRDFINKVEERFETRDADPHVIRRICIELELNMAEFCKYFRKRGIPGVEEKKKVKKAPNTKLASRAQSTMGLSSLVPNQHKDCHRTAAQAQPEKPRLNLVVVGHVDAGKSTLMGHLLFLKGRVSEGELAKLQKDAKHIGKSEDFLAWIMARDEVERERGVTIDVSLAELETPTRVYSILDAPGHRDFVPSMIAGTSMADAALLVVDAMNPVVPGGQTYEHLLLCRALGITQLLVCVNKMDFVEFTESTFEGVQEQLRDLLRIFGNSQIIFIPTCASKGDNLVEKSESMPWYNGPTVIEALERLEVPKFPIEEPFLMAINETIERNPREVIITGKIESGFVCPKDTISIVPLDQRFLVKQVDIGEKTVPFASAGCIASITVVSSQISISIPVGSAAVAPDKVLTCSQEFTARINTFEMSLPILRGTQLIFHRHAVDAPLKVVSVIGTVDRKTKEVTKSSYVVKNSCADVHFRLETPLPLDLQQNSRSFGRFIIRTGGTTIGFGSVTQIGPMKQVKFQT